MWRRKLRTAQSRLRVESMIEPRILIAAYRANGTPFSGLNELDEADGPGAPECAAIDVARITSRQLVHDLLHKLDVIGREVVHFKMWVAVTRCLLHG
jgi:hypothetical protein